MITVSGPDADNFVWLLIDQPSEVRMINLGTADEHDAERALLLAHDPPALAEEFGHLTA